MKKILSIVLVGATALTPVAALTQEMPSSVADQLAAMKAEIDRLKQRVVELETQQAGKAATIQTEMNAVVKAAGPPAPPAPAVTAKEPAQISWGGAPKITGDGGWSFKPRGRLNLDAGSFNAPDSTGRQDGFNSEIRRVRLGVEGDVPGGFSYKFEFDFEGNAATVTDAILSYEDGPLTVNMGQHNNFQSLEELTSSRWSSFIERAAFTDAFGFERRVGISAEIEPADALLIQAGVFTDNIGDLPGKAFSADGRLAFFPKLGEDQLHLGTSVHHTDVPEDDTVRYRQRPLVHFTSERFINTGNLPTSSEFGAGVEAAYISGPFHVVGEGFWQQADLVGVMQDPTFFGAYVEAGLYLTKGEKRGYKGGTFNRTRPQSPVDEGGIGAIQINVRYDHLDLTDSGIVGGTQDGYMASLVWIPTDYTRFLFNYGRLDYTDAVFPTATGDRDYSVDVFGMRAQIDF